MCQNVPNFKTSANLRYVYCQKKIEENLCQSKECLVLQRNINVWPILDLLPIKNVFYCKKKSKSVSNLGTFANLKLEVQFQFSGKFPASCHQQQTGKVIISSQECLTINNIKRIRRNVTKYIFLSLLCKIYYIFCTFFHFSYKCFECHS